MPNTHLTWEKNYEVGVPKIDEQNKELFALVNRLYVVKDDNLKEEMRDILYKFRKYMLEHFEEEEEYMRRVGFPDLLNHVEQHKNIVENISNIMKHSPNMRILKIKLQIMTKKVVIGHIKNEDIKIKHFCTPNNDKITEEIFDI